MLQCILVLVSRLSEYLCSCVDIASTVSICSLEINVTLHKPAKVCTISCETTAFFIVHVGECCSLAVWFHGAAVGYFHFRGAAGGALLREGLCVSMVTSRQLRPLLCWGSRV